VGTVIVEIRSGEGGNDAKLLVYEQFDIYRKLGGRGCL
jgi:protein subunit release factor A